MCEIGALIIDLYRGKEPSSGGYYWWMTSVVYDTNEVHMG